MWTENQKVSKSNLSKTPYWDGQAKSFGVYNSKIEGYGEFIGVGDTLDPVLITFCPTRLEFAVIAIMIPKNLTLVDVYRANNKLCTSIALG